LLLPAAAAAAGLRFPSVAGAPQLLLTLLLQRQGEQLQQRHRRVLLLPASLAAAQAAAGAPLLGSAPAQPGQAGGKAA
jgi:hypothetical protein